MNEKRKMKWNWHGALLAVMIFIYFCVYVFLNLMIDILQITVSFTSIFISVIPLLMLLTTLLVYCTSGIRNISKKQLMHTAIIGTLIFTYSIFLIGQNEKLSYFNYNRWVSEPEQRVYMIDHFLNNNSLDSLKKTQVLDLLGAATETSYFNAPNRWVYYLGDERGIMSIDSEWLLIDFDDEEQVINYDIVTD